ncbi:MAG: TolC family protein [Bacteroidales bacterium]|nr:TolC family protein [Bacteroidales bacterium]
MRTKHLILTAAAALTLTVLPSCNIYGKFKVADQSEMTREYAEALKQLPAEDAFGNLQWEEVFTDPQLADLIRMALANNKDLKNAKLNVDIAHAQLKGAKLSFLPSLALGPNGTGSKIGSYDWSWSYQLPFSVSWEVDVFGKLLNTKRSAQAAYYQSEAYQQAVRSQIIAAVANCYYGIMAINNQLILNRETAENWRESVEVMKNLKEAGRLTEAAVVQSRAQYYSILASITDIEVSQRQLYNTMSLLLNVMPQDWVVTGDNFLQAPANIVREGVPMRELASRPDVLSAEMSLASAYYTTANARAQFYPGLAISCNGGFTDLIGSVVKNPAEFFINLAGSLTIPIFSRGQNIARLEAAKAQQEQALNTFEYTLMNASAEVSNALVTYQKSLEKQDDLTVMVDQFEKSVEYTQELLSMGTSGTTYLEVLTAQQSLLSAQMAEISNRQTTAQAVVNLYQSLGGGR